MKRISIVFVGILLCIAALSGCNLFSNLTDDGLPGFLPGKGAASVRIRVVIPGAESAMMNPSIKASTVAMVNFRLTLVQLGAEASSQISIIKKQVEVGPDGSASFTFSALPAVTLVVQMLIEGGSIGGKSDFHGATDLTAGENTLDITPVGCRDINDLSAGVMLSLITLPEVIKAAPLNLVALVRTNGQISMNMNLSGAELYNDALNRFIANTSLQGFIPTMLSISADGGLIAMYGGVASWSKSPEQLWGAGSAGANLRAVRVVRHGLLVDLPAVVVFADISGMNFGIATINAQTGDLISSLLSDGNSLQKLSSVYLLPKSQSIFFGAVAGGLPVIQRWSGIGNVVTSLPPASSEILWYKNFPGIQAASALPYPDLEYLIADSFDANKIKCLVRDPRTLLLLTYFVTLDGLVEAVQPSPELIEIPLTAVAASGAVRLYWDQIPTATAYNIYWTTEPTTLPATSTATKIAGVRPPFLHTGLQNGSTYHYVVAWELNGQEKGLSRVGQATPQITFDDPVIWDPPTVVGLSPVASPATSSYGVATGTVFTIKFNEPVVAASGSVSVFQLDGLLVDQIAVNGPNVSVANDLVTISRNNYLKDDAFYYVTVAPGSFKDLSGNNFAGITDKNAWQFKTMFQYNETLSPTTFWNLYKIKAPEAWKYSTGENVAVAVIDTGIDSAHPEFADQLPLQGLDLVNDGAFCQDSIGHGTRIAGIIAAKGKNGGIIGVAPKAKLYVIKIVTSDGHTSSDKVIAGIEAAVAHGAKIINMSLGGTDFEQPDKDAVKYAWDNGSIIFAASGNSGVASITYPACYPYAVAIGAIASDSSLCSFSNYGSELSFTAPGKDIWSTIPGSSYAKLDGTSMSTPHVSAVAALIWAKNPSFTAQQVLDALVYGAVDLGAPGRDQYFGYGQIDALKSLEYQPGMASLRANIVVSSPVPPAKSDFSTKEFVQGELLLRLQPSKNLEETLSASSLQGFAIKLIQKFKSPDLYLLSVPAGREIEIGKKLQSLPQVIYAELNGIVRLN